MKLVRELQQQGYSLTINEEGALVYEYSGPKEPDPEKVEPLLAEARDKAEELKRALEPRPDLKEDSKLWQLVLRTAAVRSHKVYGVLHGIRCIGGRLELNAGNLKLLPRYGDPKVTGINGKEDWQDIRSRWLLPCKEQISAIFDMVKEGLAEKKQAI